MEYNKDYIKKLRRARNYRKTIKYKKNKDGWKNFWFDKATNSNKPDWIHGKEVRVFCMPEVDERVVPYATKGVQDLIQQIGLDFTVNYYGSDATAVQQVKESTKEDGRIDGRTLSKILIDETWRNPQCGGKPHADVIITDKYLKLGDENWGQSEFHYGYIILALPNRRQRSLGFIRNVSKHEAGHLFGFYHHDDENAIDIKGYKPVSDCNMLWQASTKDTCDKCVDALTYFWKGIEDRTGEKFFR